MSAYTFPGRGTDTDLAAIAQTTHGLAVGDWVRLSGTSYVKAKADTAANSAVAGVVSAVADANNFTLTTGGLVSGLTGLTAGALYYLSDATAGAITSTEPTGATSISRPVFIARTTTSGYVINQRSLPVFGSSFLAGVSNVGNTAGNTGITGSRLVLSGGTNITLSQSTNASGATVMISGGAGGGGSFSAGVSTDGNTAGATGVSGTRMVLVGSGIVSLSQTTGAAGNTVSILAPPQSVISAVSPLSTSTNGSTLSIIGPAQFSGGFSTQGNTSGDTGFVTGRVALVGGNNITLSGSTNGGSQTITISAGASGGGGFSAGMSTQGNTAGVTGVSGSRMVLVGSGPISLSQTTNTAGNTLTIVGPATSSLSAVSPVSISTNGSTISIGASQISAGISGGNTAGDTGAVTGHVVFAGGANITLSGSTNAGSETISIVGGAGGAFSGGMSNVGNTSGDTGITGSRLVLAGGNNVTLSQSTNASGGTVTISAFNQSVQSVGMYAVGNTTGQSSSTTRDARSLSVDGAGIVSVGYSGGTLRISASQSVQPETQTFIAGISASDTLYTSGNVRITGVGGGITVSSNTGQRVDLSVAAQTVQTQNLHNVTLSGNTAGAMAQISSGTMTLAGGANITVSQAGNAVTISGAAGGAFSAGMSTEGNTAGNTGVSGSRMVLVGSGPISLSQTTGAAGNTVSVLGPATSSLAAGANITVSTDGSTISIIGGAGGAGYSAGVSNVGNTAGDTGITGTRLVLAGTNGITLSQSTNASGGTVSISGITQSVQPGVQQIVASNASFSSGTVSISGFGDVTVNTAAGIIRISAPAQTAQTGISGVANSQTTYTSGTVSLSELGAITIRSTTGNQYQFSVNSQTEQTQSRFNLTLSGNTSGALAGISSGVMTMAGGNNITLSQAGNAVTISGPNVGGAQTGISGIANSQTTYTSGTVSLSELGAITIRSTTGNQYQFSVNAQTAQTGISSIVASDATYTSGSVQFTGSNMITVKSSANQRVVIDATQSVQPGVQRIVASDASFSSGTVSISGFGAATVNTAANIIRISVPVQTAETAISGLANSQTTYTSGTVSMSELGAITIRSTTGNQYQFSVNSQTEQTQSRFNLTLSGNTAGALAGISSGVMTLAGGNNITVSQAGNAVTISAPNLGAGAMSAGVSTGGNTAGATGITGTQLVLVGSNNITLSQTTGANGGTVSIIGGAGGGFSAGVSTGGNTAGATGISGTQMVLVGSGPISLSQTTGANGNTVSVNAPATSSLVAGNDISISTNGSTITIMHRNTLADWQNFPRQQASLISHVSAFSKTPIYWQDHLDGDVLAKSAAFAISMVTASQPLSVSVHLGVYTLVNSTSMALLGSHSEAYVISSATSVSLSGVRNVVMTGIGTHGTLSSLPSGEYAFGMMFSATATNAMNFSLLGASGGAGPLGALYPGTNNYSAATNQGIQALRGRGSTTVNAMPANVQASELVNQGTAASMALHPWIYIRS